MKLLRKILALVMVFSLGLVLVGCDMLKKKDSTKTTKKPNKSDLTTTRPTVSKEKPIVENGLFVLARSYTFNYNKSTKVDGVTYNVTMSLRLAFDTAGSATLVDLKGEADTIEYTYTIDNRIITCTNKSNSNIDYYYYYEDVIVSADIFLMPGTLDGAAVSQAGTGTLAYCAYVVLKQGDIPAVLASDSSNTNKYYTLRKNGTFSTTGKYVIADQLELFNTTAKGKYVTTMQVSKKAYPVVVCVE